MDFQSKWKRRDFIRAGISGSAGLLALDAIRAQAGNPEEKSAPAKLVYRTLGKTGLRLPVVSMGVMNADNPALVDAALKAGIVHLDTAYVYQRGRNEEMIGKVIKNYPRDSYVIGTKIRTDRGDAGSGGNTGQEIIQDLLDKLETSLRRLQLEYVDILYLHSLKQREEVLFEPYLKALDKARKEGKTRFVGFSTHSNEAETIHAAVDGKFFDVILTAYNFKHDDREELGRAMARAAGAGIGIVAMKTMAGGFFDKLRLKAVNTRAALKWVLQNENVHTTIPGMTTFDQLESNLSVMADLNLNEEEKRDLGLGVLMEGLYCQGCQVCVKQCPERLPIPDFMRAYMYAYGYQNSRLAKDLLSTLKVKSNLCADCSDCRVQCAKGFAVAEKIRDIARLHDVPDEFLS